MAFGIQHEDFGPERADPAVRRELMGPLADDPAARLLLITGRLAVDKRQALLVDAVQELARRRPVALCVLGDGPARATIEEKARGLPATFLSFTRDRGHYAAILASVDALVHGSRCETYGFVLAETLASGTPIVAPDAGGAGAMAVDGCAERYRPDADVREIASAIDRLLDRDREGLRAAALAMAAEQPSTQQHFDALFALYAQMLAERGEGVGAGASV